jgi:hypothetical protein
MKIVRIFDGLKGRSFFAGVIDKKKKKEGDDDLV